MPHGRDTFTLVKAMLPMSESTEPPRSLWQYGVFSGSNMSTEEDFKIAEWQPVDMAYEEESFVEVRAAEETELDQLAQLWFDSWQDAHAKIVPAALTELRTVESFRDRLAAMLGDVRVVGPVGAAVGFCAIKGDELYQLFVAAEGRGKGVAAVLLADGEARLAANGVETAWLACSVGNYRAARFYEKWGWRLAGRVTIPVETYKGPFMLEVWRYEKVVSQPGSFPRVV